MYGSPLEQAAELGSQPQELSCMNPALTARLPRQSFNLFDFSYLIPMKGIICIHLQRCLWSGSGGLSNGDHKVLDTLQESHSSRGRCVRGCIKSRLLWAHHTDVLRENLWDQVF